MIDQTTDISARALPLMEGDMGHRFLPDGSTRVDYAYRGESGRPTHSVAYIQTQDLDAINRKLDELKAAVRAQRNDGNAVTASPTVPCSLTVGDCLRTYVRDNGYGGMDDKIIQLERDLGRHIADRSFAPKCATYFADLDNSLATIQRKKACLRMAFNYCVDLGILPESPVTNWRMKKETPRNRILTAKEERRLLRVLMVNRSYLYMPVRFALLNPIRYSDLWNLTTRNLDLERGYVWNRAKKTDEVAYLIVWDKYIREYFRKHKTGYLFPNQEGGRVGYIKRHWATMLRAAKIKDFRFHDLRRCAATKMLQSGFTDRDLIDLGLWKSISMITRYHAGNAHRVIQKFKERVATVATRAA